MTNQTEEDDIVKQLTDLSKHVHDDHLVAFEAACVIENFRDIKERLLETLFRHISIEPDSEFKREIGLLVAKLKEA